jgi:hypothetical protein
MRSLHIVGWAMILVIFIVIAWTWIDRGKW